MLEQRGNDTSTHGAAQTRRSPCMHRSRLLSRGGRATILSVSRANASGLRLERTAAGPAVGRISRALSSRRARAALYGTARSFKVASTFCARLQRSLEPALSTARVRGRLGVGRGRSFGAHGPRPRIGRSCAAVSSIDAEVPLLAREKRCHHGGRCTRTCRRSLSQPQVIGRSGD